MIPKDLELRKEYIIGMYRQLETIRAKLHLWYKELQQDMLVVETEWRDLNEAKKT